VLKPKGVIMQILRLNIKFLIFFTLFPTMSYPFWPFSDEDTSVITEIPKDGFAITIATPYSTGPNDNRIVINNRSLFPPLPKMPDQETMTAYWNLSCKTLKNNAFKITAATILAIYAWIFYQIRQTNSLIKKHDAWCNWKSIVPLAHLQLASKEDLLTQLKIDLYKKYALACSNASTCDYTFMFIDELKSEIALFDVYLHWLSVTQTIWCDKLFYFSHDATAIEEKKARLFFLLDLFMAWYSQSNAIVIKMAA
jgi:hypothetical protein